MRALCLFVHFFDPEGDFPGKSKFQSADVRKWCVERALHSVRSISFVDVQVCGYGDQSLIDIDRDFRGVAATPELMMYEVLASLAGHVDEYDYFMVLEDDILVGADIFYNVQDFDSTHPVTEVLLPNRVEINSDAIYCVDTRARPGTTDRAIWFRGRLLQEFINPHSGVLLLSRSRLQHVLETVDLGYRGKFWGGYMASAFAHFHKPLTLYRVADGLDFHTVQHLDQYVKPAEAEATARYGSLRRLGGKLLRPLRGGK